ncbi:hypothetical protein [Mucilaginibacter gotjawali]|uniref:Outer membrane protein beta-barrel domain-containing protein n=1 Tax=Mucilaginibacter gotjawali TaxID=1550579 RepID=A0A839SD81_9SPHI|nr:hypothetical protein [Mucilaginibacter gotjawali]MBB3054629.1 hypothetical protein [Mucilaginibacter gotjawali]
MNKENNEGLDDLFKKKLEDPVYQAGFREEDWGALEKMLERHKKPRGIVYWLPVVSGLAALLLVVFGWWFFKGATHQHNSQKMHLTAINHPQKNSGKNGGPARQTATHSINTTPAPVTYAGNLKPGKNSAGSKIFLTSADGARRTAGQGITVNDTLVNRSGEMLVSKAPVPQFANEQLAIQTLPVIDLSKRNSANAAITSPDKKSIKKINTKRAFIPQYALTVLAAPDINGVGSFQQSKVGTNIGLQFSAEVTKKLTITTGAVYSVKPYITGFDNYHTLYHFKADPINVTADCRMLDIPINLGYQVFNKRQNRITIGTGLSSYIMVHESYKFNYANTYITGPSSYTVPNSNKYFFGVLNLNATYQRQLNQKVGLTIQPYVKLPLANIGYSQVRLQTTGVAIGLSWNLNSSSTP